MPAWSYSSIKMFDQCAKKYYHLRIAKDIQDTSGPEAVYGTEVHAAAEAFVKHGVPIPPKYNIIKPVAEKLASFPGDKHCELKLGVKYTDGGYAPCDFFAKDVWYRGIADLLIVDGPKARLIDYKTGKNARYADIKQLDLMAGAVFVHFPEVEKIKAGLAYVVSNEFPTKDYCRDEGPDPLSVFADQLARLDAAMENDVWNANPGPLCGWCPVGDKCEHWKPRYRR
jgi:hypothetical protein